LYKNVPNDPWQRRIYGTCWRNNEKLDQQELESKRRIEEQIQKFLKGL
jgi:hypothetical protein